MFNQEKEFINVQRTSVKINDDQLKFPLMLTSRVCVK